MEVNQLLQMTPTSLDMIPQWCKNILITIDSQQARQWSGSLHTKSKVLLVGSFDECRVCEIIVRCANMLINTKTPHQIWSFGCGADQLFREGCEKRISIGTGLELWSDDSQISSEDAIWESIDLVISHLKQGWEKKKLVDFPDIPDCDKQDESEWVLYVKNPLLYEEDCLIRFLLNIFIMKDDVLCYSTHPQHYIYMWIRREKIDLFAQKFWCI